ncbi:MBL fold metallo-hydrolase [Infirmifilum lucidum]|uniref:MBL fold metallo-hydrolase n=1 Tax=Infirmifilum lucidum TaxID=2776706 RepID=A0A7L9FJ25_9CREN|nr:MBL fold metallo-hydrolase [Infirmifilum lucidum]QOJ79342.1 MBL fold metallo-hydrolase [Infirmifilum lucidum]
MLGQVIILVDDSAFGTRGLLAEHGFSVLISYKGKRVLFDAGQMGVPLLLNASALGINLAHLDAVVLSHGHYDHSGGLYTLTRVLRGKPLLVAHPLALKPSLKIEGGERRDVGIPYSAAFLEEHFQLTLSEGVLEVAPGVYFLGEIPRYYPDLVSHIPGVYTVSEEGLSQHTFADDTAVAVDLGEELLVVAGCSHSGVVNIALHASRLLGKPPSTILGGLHLSGKPLDFLDKVREKLKEIGVVKVYPGHCTGTVATVKILERFRGEELGVGKVIDFDH